MATVTRLSDVGFGGSAEVELAGEIFAKEPVIDPQLGTSVAALRTDVGFTIPVQRNRGKEWVFRVAKTLVRAGEGLALRTPDGVVELDPERLELDQETKFSTDCEGPPEGFESVKESPLYGKGPMQRRDHRLLQGDRVELVGTIEPKGANAFATVGSYELHDLSIGQLTRAEDRARDRKFIGGFVVLVVVIAAIAIGVALSPSAG